MLGSSYANSIQLRLKRAYKFKVEATLRGKIRYIIKLFYNG
jgi:hypothetical protein